METLISTNFKFPNQKNIYKGKVREVYDIHDDLIVVIASDRISAFDVIMPKGIPYKGQVLNQVAAQFLNATKDEVPNWLIATPDPCVSIGLKCEPYRVEMVIRGYLAGHAWREYKSGKRMICGVPMPEGMKENDPFPTPIITPATKAEEGHDEDISREDILSQNIIAEEEYLILEKYTRKLFELGSKMANEKGLMLVDTKYEFGKRNGKIYLIDEIHTPDSSRYFYADEYKDRQKKGLPQKQLSKEFVREWLMEKGFQGKTNQKIPEMKHDFIEEITNRYIELYEKITGNKFIKYNLVDIDKRVERNILNFLVKYNSK